MMMRYVFCAGIALVLCVSCNNKNDTGKFSVSGDIKNLPDQQVYIEEVYFDQRSPEVLDTADVKKGKFVLDALAYDEGLFKIRFEKSNAVFLVINDKSEVSVTADNNNLSVRTVNVHSAASASLKNFIGETNTQLEKLESLANEIKALQKTPETDSQYTALSKAYEEKDNVFRKYVLDYVDTCRSAPLAAFAIGFVGDMPVDKLEKSITALNKRFPGNMAVGSVVNQFNEAKKRQTQPVATPVPVPKTGDMAPEITMPDTEGKMFSLSSLRGKYVLVDFWASWCGPCRDENPNVVKAYNRFSNKNFTVLGVSLDKKKEAWLDAIKTDGLNWKHISDLKQWDSEAQKLYQFQGIPYNVLVDPQGKIIAVSLRGKELESKLAEVLK